LLPGSGAFSPARGGTGLAQGAGVEIGHPGQGGDKAEDRRRGTEEEGEVK